jgi:hypothetical protein
LEKALESSSRERRFSGASYRVRSLKDQPFGFRRHEKISSVEEFISFGQVPRQVSAPAVVEWRAMEDEIKAADFVLGIEDDSESNDFVPYLQVTLSRATGFLRRLMIHAHSSKVVGIGVPQIGPADSGSIDLFWERGDRTLLINFPADESSATYYGKKPKSEISGRFDPSEARAELVFWLAD